MNDCEISKKVAKHINKLIEKSEYENVHRFCNENKDDVVLYQSLGKYIKNKHDMKLGNVINICKVLNTSLIEVLQNIS